MKRLNGSKKLLYALTDVKDIYVRDAIKFANDATTKNRVKIIPLRQTMRIVGTVAACFVLVFVGYKLISINHNTETGGDTVTSVNPYQEVTELSEAEAITGFEMEVPDIEKPYSKIVITVIGGNMIEAAYSTEDDTDIGYYIRKAEGAENVSGDYNEYAQNETENVGNAEVTLKGDSNSWSVATWTSDGYSYAIECQNHPMTKDQILALVQKTK
jgi:hypothetical protein